MAPPEVPQTDPRTLTYEQVNESIEAYGEACRELDLLETAMKEDLAKVKKSYEIQSADAKFVKAVRAKLIAEWCKAHRREITKDGKVKYHRFPAGRVIWRANKPSVSVAAKAISSVLAYLHAHPKLRHFIRMSETIDKAQMLAEPELAQTVDGIKITKGGETFVIEPFGAALAQPPEDKS